MSISIYYAAVRKRGLTEPERAAVTAIKDRYSVNSQIEHYLQTGTGLNWESFILYAPPLSPGAIIEGATKLPDNSEDALWVGMQHWCKALSELRRLIPDAIWHVHVEDHHVQWDEEQQAYDPTK